MTLGNMRELGVHHLIAYCHNDACRHSALIDVSGYPDVIEVPSFQRRAKCGKCGRRGHWVDVRPNWKEAPGSPDNWHSRRRVAVPPVISVFELEAVQNHSAPATP